MKIENMMGNGKYTIDPKIVEFLSVNSHLKPLYAISETKITCFDTGLNHNWDVVLFDQSVRVVHCQ